MRTKTTPSTNDVEIAYIPPTPKDFTFYNDVYHQKLGEQQRGLHRMIQFHEREMERTGLMDFARVSHELDIERLTKMLEDNADKTTKACDAVNEEFMSFMQKHLQAKEKQKINQQLKKDMVAKKKDEQRAVLNTFHSRERAMNYEKRRSKREMDLAWERLNQIDREMPDYMRSSLRRMPNNKGYIYRGVRYYGYLPPENTSMTTLFERVKGIQYIHEYTYFNGGKEFRLYEKLSAKSPKTLVRLERYTNK
jgi:hypothetical protein